jgi:zinc protease
MHGRLVRPLMAVQPVPRPRVKSFRLANGLRVLLAPIESSPTASVWVWYNVGSKNEHPGITGASHWVEHMLFEGSPRYPKGAIDRAVVQVGGELNAFTDTDFTAYFTTVPREHLSIPLDIESDRMTRALLADREVDRERTVILSEREGNENWPEFQVEEEVYSLAFRIHPYRWDALGRKEDIEGLSPEELRTYYRKFYGTRNATLVIAGGFDLPRLTAEVRRRFGRLPASGGDVSVATPEPVAHGERRAELTGPGTTPYIQLAWRAPAVDDPTTPALMILDTVLGGESRLFSAGWGRSSEHPSARLYRALVESGLAVRATSEWRPRVYPGLFTIQAQAARGVTLDRVETGIEGVTERLARSGPTRRELDDARVRIRRGAALAYEGASRTGFRLGYFAVLRSPEYEDEILRRLLAVTRAQVQAQARALFRPDSRVVVRYTPSGEKPDA